MRQIFTTLALVISISLLPGCSKKTQPKYVPEDMLEFYATQSPVTLPGNYSHLYDSLPTDIPGIVGVVQNNLLHLAEIEMQKLPVARSRIDCEINTRTVEEILEKIAKSDNPSLLKAKNLTERHVGICTHFVLLTCSMLRRQKIPCRARGGFETYYSDKNHHDHWICEYWNAEQLRSIRIDPEINPYLKEKWKVPYDPLNLPDSVFITGPAAWVACRNSKKNPNAFGVMGESWVGGWNFVLTEIVLDFLALNKKERLPWDGISLSEKGYDNLTAYELKMLDCIARLVQSGDSSFTIIRKKFYENDIFR